MKLDATDYHPDFFGGTSVKPSFVAGGGFSGWNFNTGTIGDQTATNTISSLLHWHDLSGGVIDPGNYTQVYSAGSPGATDPFLTITKHETGEGDYTIGQGPITAGIQSLVSQPLSLSRGEFIFSPFQTATDPVAYWECGLTRPLTQENLTPDWTANLDQAFVLTAGSSLPVGFMDYKLTWAEDDTNADKYTLFIEQAINDGGTFKMTEVKYYGIASPGTLLNTQLTQDNCAGQINTSLAATRYVKFKFVAEGENLVLWALGGGKNDPTGTWVKIVDSTQSKALTQADSGLNVPTSFKPINPNCWNLYPKIGMIAEDDYIDINKWGGRTASGIYPGEEIITPASGSGTDLDPFIVEESIVYYGTSLWANSWGEYDPTNPHWVHKYNAVQQIDTQCIGNSVAGSATYVRKLMIASNETPNLVVAILPQSDGKKTISEKGVYSSRLANSANLLGFPGQTEVVNLEQGALTDLGGTVITSGTAAKWKVYSNIAPIFSTQTAFIKIPTLTHESLNMAKGLPSKILYQIPRFSNSGKEYGNLYFEANEKTYLKLRNATELNINELQIDIVNIDETYVRDLEGQTSVVLHFRQSR